MRVSTKSLQRVPILSGDGVGRAVVALQRSAQGWKLSFLLRTGEHDYLDVLTRRERQTIEVQGSRCGHLLRDTIRFHDRRVTVQTVQ